MKKVVERGVWSEEEHDKFLAALKVYPKGPWKLIAVEVGTRSSRQVQTHAQKYYEKVARRVRGLRKDRKKVVRLEHRLGDADIASLFQMSGTEQRSGSAFAGGLQQLKQEQAQQQQQNDMELGMASLSAVGPSAALSSRSADSLSFVSLLQAQRQHEAAAGYEYDSTSSDSDDADSLADVDAYYLDFLIQVLSWNPHEEFGDVGDESSASGGDGAGSSTWSDENSSSSEEES